MTRIISSKITEAIEFCALAHKDQKRKASDIPFASHPISVGFILQSAGYSEEVIIAGILHDILEDTSYTEKEIESQFGAKILHLVKGVTENTQISSWEDKKKDYLNKIQKSENNIKAISAADLLDNSKSILRKLKLGIDIWGSFNTEPRMIIKNYKERLSVLKYSINKELEYDLENTIIELEKNIK